MADNLNVTSPDFSELKQNFINYCKNQSEFTDYSFEGSATNFLMDILAYNTYYNAVHTNLAFSETFLDSAVIRNNVVSRGQELGYIPRSKSASTANVNITFSVTGNPFSYTIPKNTKFTSSNGSTNYSFVTLSDVVVTNTSNSFTTVLELVQGKNTTYDYTVDLTNPLQRFIIPDKNVDTKYLNVYFKASSSDTNWTVVKNIIDLGLDELEPNANVYLLRETYDGFYQIVFGDDVIGRKVVTGNVIRFEYVITDGADANGARIFSLGNTLSGVSGVTLTTVDAAAGGNDREDIDSIKHLAPLSYQAQDRAVTENDYIVILKNNYSNIDDVAVWGGEKNDPPFYGKVFICIKPKNSYNFLSSLTKQKIQNEILQKYNILSIRPEILDPDYIYVDLDITSIYNSRLYTTSSDLINRINNSVSSFFDNNANKFSTPIYYSKLLSAIDASTSTIKSSILNYTLTKKTEVFTGIAGNYKFTYNNSITPNSVVSNAFIIDNVTWYLRDVPEGTSPYTTGKLIIYRKSGDTEIILNNNIGSIDYDTGTLIISNLKIDSIPDDVLYRNLSVTVSPGQFVDPSRPSEIYTDMNIYTNGRNQIITLRNVDVTLVSD